MSDLNLVQKAYTEVVKHIVQTGRAPHFTELAETMGLLPDEALNLQREATKIALASWFVENTNYIESWAPFSNVPTPYLVTVNGQQKWYGQ